MRYELTILRAMLRLARRRQMADTAALLDRVGGTAARLRTTLRALEAHGFVERLDDTTARLTMSGLAVAMATVPPVAAKKTRARATKRKARAA